MRIDLTDVTFTIPVFYDHPDRRENLDLVLEILQSSLNTSIAVYETGERPQFDYLASTVHYQFVPSPIMHRTKLLNQMAREATTPIIVNYDADVLLLTSQIQECIEMIRAGRCDGCFPYDGRFANLSREVIPKIRLGHLPFLKGVDPADKVLFCDSVGGAIAWVVASSSKEEAKTRRSLALDQKIESGSSDLGNSGFAWIAFPGQYIIWITGEVQRAVQGINTFATTKPNIAR